MAGVVFLLPVSSPARFVVLRDSEMLIAVSETEPHLITRELPLLIESGGFLVRVHIKMVSNIIAILIIDMNNTASFSIASLRCNLQEKFTLSS